MLMFSLLLNIYAKWHPEMFNPYLPKSPGDDEAEAEGREDWGAEVESATAAVLLIRLIVKHQSWPWYFATTWGTYSQ